jgi:hypothetical protein
MRTLTLVLLAALAIAVGAPAAIAGPRDRGDHWRSAGAELDPPRRGTDRRAHRHHDRRAHRGERVAEIEDKRARVRQRIRALRVARLTEALDLDERTAARLFSILDRYDERFAGLTAELSERRHRLREALEGRSADGAALDALVDEMLARQRALFELQEQRYRDVRRVLTAEQAARLLVVLPELDRRLHREIRTFGKDRGAGPRHRGRGPRPRP